VVRLPEWHLCGREQRPVLILFRHSRLFERGSRQCQSRACP
jgi:F0F1-type ATP synthase alpha subunit